MKYFVRNTKSFRKDFKKIKSQNKDLTKLQGVILTLRDGEKLNESFRDHSLKGEYEDCMECHIEPD